MKAARELTPIELRTLSEAQQAYLLRRPGAKCLQPHMLAREALYQTAEHGAVTIDRAIELDDLHSQFRAAQVRPSETSPAPGASVVDAYSAAEDAFIDQNGMSPGLS